MVCVLGGPVGSDSPDLGDRGSGGGRGLMGQKHGPVPGTEGGSKMNDGGGKGREKPTWKKHRPFRPDVSVTELRGNGSGRN